RHTLFRSSKTLKNNGSSTRHDDRIEKNEHKNRVKMVENEEICRETKQIVQEEAQER
ncbi:hypothetical protein A2U01_0094535, partial [Trifolium medium]|nr:hypothetical protein [Trifolium medium]